MIAEYKAPKWLIAIGCLSYCLILYAPLVVRGGIIVDDWGNIASTLSCSGFIDCYRQNFPIFANRPLAPLPITLLTQLFGQHYFAYLLINTTLYLGAIGITGYVVSKVAGGLPGLTFGALACAPFIAMPIIASPINQSTASISYLYWSLAVLSTYLFCKRAQGRYLWLSFGFLLASFLTYEITLPLVVFLMLFPMAQQIRSGSFLSIDYLKQFIAPVVGVLATSLFWQKIIGPHFIEIPSRLHFEPSAIIPQFLAWANVFLENIPHLVKKAFSVSTPSAYILAILFALLLIAYPQNQSTKVLEPRRYLFFLITLLTFIASSALYVLSGAAVEVGGYGSRGLSSTWFSFSLLLAGFIGLWTGYKRFGAIIFITIVLFCILKPFIASRNNYINSWKLQNIILSDFFEHAKQVQLGPNALVIANIPEFTPSNFNNETVFSTSWDFPAALRLLSHEAVSTGLVIDTRSGNFHSLTYQNQTMQADGFWSAKITFPSTPIWAYDFNLANQKGALRSLKSEADVKNQLLSWGYLESPTHQSYINLNQVIYFGIPWNQRQNYILDGWYGEIESWGGIWSIGNKSIIRLPLPTQKPQSLELMMQAFVSSKHPHQRINIFFDGQLQRTAILSQFKDNHISVPIPPSIANQSSVEVSFELPDAVSPKQLSMGDDDRRLAIGLQSATYY